MTYATLMVQLETGKANADILQLVGDLAERFKAAVIGVSVRQPSPYLYTDGYAVGAMADSDRARTDRELEMAQAEFEQTLGSRATTRQFRSAETLLALSDYLAREARCADLFITNVGGRQPLLDIARHANIGDLIMQIGKPVLVVPEKANKLSFGHALVGWKDTRETRRAVVDALPLLKMSKEVSLVEIAPETERDCARARLDDVALWLKRHGVAATTHALRTTGDDAERLAVFVQESRVDFIVAGAYGHSRVREWALGGVTHDLLLRAKKCALLSH